MNFIYSVAWILACKLKFEDKVIFSETGKRFENQHKITSSRMFFNHVKVTRVKVIFG